MIISLEWGFAALLSSESTLAFERHYFRALGGALVDTSRRAAATVWKEVEEVEANRPWNGQQRSEKWRNIFAGLPPTWKNQTKTLHRVRYFPVSQRREKKEHATRNALRSPIKKRIWLTKISIERKEGYSEELFLPSSASHSPNISENGTLLISLETELNWDAERRFLRNSDYSGVKGFSRSFHRLPEGLQEGRWVTATSPTRWLDGTANGWLCNIDQVQEISMQCAGIFFPDLVLIVMSLVERWRNSIIKVLICEMKLFSIHSSHKLESFSIHEGTLLWLWRFLHFPRFRFNIDFFLLTTNLTYPNLI